MPEYTLQFIIMIDGPSSDQEIVDAIRTPFPDSGGGPARCADLRGNFVDIFANSDADQAKMSGEDGFLFYGFELQASPTKPTIQEAEQIRLARDLKAVFESRGWKAEVGANFEDKL
ncbi:hypothetical protein [Blastopirellula retiformator]|uniref:Uncharacterized protein n=1 Tax=Blastopirellula retiformator TaxID=2527970 RepID=A0A5C5UVX0_9BACT|nr:hypothetical protein [Blastopirellula retiformator]TWT29697.1 hypothetical protein Enr8_48850 [Blastopirellula retiformator]